MLSMMIWNVQKKHAITIWKRNPCGDYCLNFYEPIYSHIYYLLLSHKYIYACAICNNFFLLLTMRFPSRKTIQKWEGNLNGYYSHSHMKTIAYIHINIQTYLYYTYEQYLSASISFNIFFNIILWTFCLAFVFAEYVQFCKIDLVVERFTQVRCLAFIPFYSNIFMNRMFYCSF